MKEFWLPLQSIPPSGLVKEYDDQSVWASLFTKFDVPCRIADPVRASVKIETQETGVSFKGRLSGTLVLPCNRCSEESVFTLDSGFHTFEPFPTENADEEEDLSGEVDEAVIRLAVRGNGIEINPLALAWEELVLALPVKPLCTDGCKGLCPRCGTNLNTGACECANDGGDPRLAPLRGLRLKK